MTVHLDSVVTCSSDDCARALPRAYWYSIHGAFSRCGEASGEEASCGECGFVDP